MTEQEISQRVNRLERELRATCNGIERYMERNPHTNVKTVAEGRFKDTLSRFTEKEIRKARVKTYDWFFDESNPLEGPQLRALQNGKGENRYFIIEPSREVSLNSMVSIGQQQVRELPIWHHEISARISSSPAVFAKMLEMTVSEVEDAKIWDAYDTVDEKTIITVTLSIPIAIITAIEVLPALYTFGQSSVPLVKTSLTAATEGAGTRLAYEAGSEYFARGMEFGEMNVIKVASATFVPNIASDLVGSHYSYSLNKGFKTLTLEQTAVNLAATRISRGLNSKLGGVSKALGPKGAVKAYEMTFTLGIKTGSKSIGREVKDKLDEK